MDGQINVVAELSTKKKKPLLEEAKELINGINTIDANKEALLDLTYYLTSKIQRSSIMRHIECVNMFLAYLDTPNKEFKDITRKEMQIAVAGLMTDTRFSEDKKRRILLSLKVLYKHLLGEDFYYPPQVAFIKTTMKTNKAKLPEDLLTEDHIKKMLNAAISLRDKAIIALLWDTGIRIGELVNIKIRDVGLEGEVAHIQVYGKTGARKVPIVFSVPYLSAYLQLRENAKPEDALFVSEGTWKYAQRRAASGGIAKVLRVTAQRAGINKRIYPHLFRHSRATNLANRLTEPQMRQFFGWTKGSGMTSVYVHLSGRDLDDSFLRAIGKKPPEKIFVQQTERPCTRCKKINPGTNIHCSQCGAALEIVEAIKYNTRFNENKQLALEALRGSIGDKEFFEKLVHTYYLTKQGKNEVRR